MIRVYFELPDLPDVNFDGKFYDAVGRIVEQDVKLGYVRQKSPAGIPWLPSKRVQKHGGLTLVLTGKLRDSLTYTVGNDLVDVGYPMIGHANVAKYLHEGHSKGYYPAREHLGLSAGAEEKIERLIERVLNDN